MFLSVVNSFVPIRTFRVSSKTKIWFDIDILRAILRELTNTILNMQCFISLKNINMKKLHFEETIAENKNNPKEH